MTRNIHGRSDGVGGLQGIWDEMLAYGESPEGTALGLVREAAGETPDDLTFEEIDRFLARTTVRDPSRPEFTSRAEFFAYAEEAILAYLDRQNSNPAPSRLLRLSDLGSAAVSYLGSHGIPRTPAGFEAYIQNLNRAHVPKVDEGLSDMIGDYFVIAQPTDVRQLIYESLSLSAGLSPTTVATFLTAVDSDVDPHRRALLTREIGRFQAGGIGREEAARRLIASLDATYRRYIDPTNLLISGDSYVYDGHGYRTTTLLHLSAAHTGFLRTDLARASLPRRVEKVLIIGPGLEIVDVFTGSKTPRQMYEPFVMIDALIRNGLADARSLNVDLLDINPEVIAHAREAVQRAQAGRPYVLQPTLGGHLAHSKIVQEHFRSFGASLPGAQLGPIRRLANGATAREVRIPPEVVRVLRPVLGDMTTDRFSEEGRYDLILCFNTMVYLNQTERLLAGINIHRALKDGGVFWTDNRFETDSGERPGQMAHGQPTALFDRSFLDLFVDETRWLFPERPAVKQIMQFYRKGDRQ